MQNPANQAGTAAPPIPADQLRRFYLELKCGGAPYIWNGAAANEQGAFRLAAHDLAVQFPNVEADQVQLVACVEVAS